MEQKNAPELRFKEFQKAWPLRHPQELFEEVKDRNHPEKDVLTIRQGRGTVLRSESGIDISYKEDTKKTYKCVEPGDFIIHLRSFQGGLEIANSEGLVSPAYTILRRKTLLDTDFYKQYFHTNKFINHELRKSVEGIRDGRQISYQQFKATQIPYPDFQEQEKIADFLTDLDHRIDLSDKKLSTLQTIKKGMLQKIFSQELRFKDNDGNDFPAWEKDLLGNRITCFSGGTPSVGKREYYDGSIPFIRSAEISAENTELTLSQKGLAESSAKMVSTGDLLCALYGANSGDCAISKISGAINQAILCIRPINDTKEYISQWLMHNRPRILHKYLQGGQGNLSASLIKQLCMPFPSLPEQQKIAAYFTALDRAITATQKKADALRTLKRGLLQKLFI